MTDRILTGREVVELLLENEGAPYFPEIEKLNTYRKEWTETRPLDWSVGELLSTEYQFRIKPAPKPDVVCEGLFGHYDNGHLCYHVSSPLKPNLRLTFDGETGKLKKAEVL